MASLSSIKPFLPIIVTYLIPRAISAYRSLKIALKTRPPPHPLPAKTSRSLNILFLSICLFFILSMPSLYSASYQANIFEATDSRLLTPTEVLFSRLAAVRPLTLLDEALREKITTPVTRQLYLRYGPSTLTSCPFCHPSDPTSYLLHHAPFHVLLPHLSHILLLGLATSTPISGPPSSRYRTALILSALALASLDAYITATFAPSGVLNPSPSPSTSDIAASPPNGLYWRLLTLRPLAIAAFDLAAAAIIYVSATNRAPFLFSPSPSSISGGSWGDEGQRKAGQMQLLTQSGVAMQMALVKMRGVRVVRSAVVRDGELKGREDEYWRVVVDEVEGEGSSTYDAADEKARGGWNVWDEEEVMEAVARVTNGANEANGRDGRERGQEVVDVETVGREAGLWVENITRVLDEG